MPKLFTVNHSRPFPATGFGDSGQVRYPTATVLMFIALVPVAPTGVYYLQSVATGLHLAQTGTSVALYVPKAIWTTSNGACGTGSSRTPTPLVSA